MISSLQTLCKDEILSDKHNYKEKLDYKFVMNELILQDDEYIDEFIRKLFWKSESGMIFKSELKKCFGSKLKKLNNYEKYLTNKYNSIFKIFDSATLSLPDVCDACKITLRFCCHMGERFYMIEPYGVFCTKQCDIMMYSSDEYDPRFDD